METSPSGNSFRDHYQSELGKFATQQKQEKQLHVEDEECIVELSIKRRSNSLGGDDETLVSALTAATRRQQSLANQTSRNIFGREAEISGLMKAYRSVCTPQAMSKVVLIQGSGGSGKSLLVNASLRSTVTEHGGYFVEAKFDKLGISCRSDPYPAIVAALTDLCDLIAQQQNYSATRKRKFALEMGGPRHVHRLSRLLGNLHRITGPTSSMSSSNHSVGSESDDAKSTATGLLAESNLAFSLQLFLRACTSPKHPLCFFLDDFHNADVASIDLIHNLVHDGLSRNILFVCAYREMETAPMIREALSCLGEGRSKVLQLPNLPPKAVETLVANLLHMPPNQRIISLANIVLKKTHGHALCVIQFIQLLQQDGLIQNSGRSWIWDNDEIQSNTNVTDNVADLVTQKVKKMHKYVQLILKVASAIGYDFDVRLLEAVIVTECLGAAADKSKIKSNFHQKIQKYLVQAFQQHLIERTSESTKFKFVHDRVRDCVYEMIPVGLERQQLHLRIGQCLETLMQHVSDEQEPPEWMVYCAAEQLSQAKACMTTPEERISLVEMNLQAAELALNKSAFGAAIDYLRDAQSMMPDTVLFQHKYQLALDLYTALAEVEYAVGDFDRCQVAAQAVMKYSKQGRHRMSPTRAMVDSMDSQGKGTQAAEHVIDLMETFKESVDVRILRKPKAQAIYQTLTEARRLMQNYTDSDLINLPFLKNDKHQTRLKLLSMISTIIPIAGGCNDLLPLASTLCIMQLSLTEGIAPLSTQAFAVFGSLLAASGHDRDAYRMGNVALGMLERFYSPVSIQTCTLSFVHGCCRHWFEPLKASLAPLMKAYEEGMVAGDIKYSCFAAYNYLMASLESGVSLPQVEVDIRTFCEGLDDMCTVNNFRTIILPVWQKVLNLMGKSENPLILDGSAMEERTYLSTPSDGSLLVYNQAKLVLAYHFGDYPLAEKTVQDLENDTSSSSKMLSGHFGTYKIRMYSCLTLLNMAEQSGKRKHYSKALKILTQLEQWMRNGNPNCRPMVLLLRAEHKSLSDTASLQHSPGSGSYHYSPSSTSSGNYKHAFDAAITEARASGLQQLEALGYERAAMACFRDDDFAQGARSLIMARNVYQRWGAHAKVSQMENQYPMFFNSNHSRDNHEMLDHQDEKLKAPSRNDDESKSHSQNSFAVESN